MFSNASKKNDLKDLGNWGVFRSIKRDSFHSKYA